MNHNVKKRKRALQKDMSPKRETAERLSVAREHIWLLQGAIFGGKLEREDGYILSILINFYINNINYNYS